MKNRTLTLVEQCDKARMLARLVAGDEIGDRPFYLVHHSDLPEELKIPGVAGWTAPTADLELREVIGDKWEGRGRAVVVSGLDLWENCFVMLHELAHVVERLRRPVVNTSLGRTVLARVLAAPATATGERLSHSSRWHRTMAHLQFRIPRNREFESLRGATYIGDYGFGPWPLIRDAFAEECSARRWERIDEILESDLPSKALPLFS
jgi:hypothetical protein